MVKQHHIAWRITSYVMSFMMLFYPITYSWADAITDAAASGVSDGTSMGNNYYNNLPSYDNGTGDFDMSGTTVNIYDLFPSASGAVSDYSNTFQSDSGATNLGQTAQGQLLNEASATGGAYRTVLDVAQNPSPSLNDDPIWAQTASSIENAELVAEFAGCTINEEVVSGATTTIHIPDYKDCNRLSSANVDCEVTHDYEIKFIRHVSGPNTISSCGTGCMDMYLGRIGDNYWSGWCSIYESTQSIYIDNPDAITSATLEHAVWDDYIQIYVGGNKYYNGPNSNFPPETSGGCELGTSWNRSLAIDVTDEFKQEGPLDFKVRVSVAGNGEGYARLRLRYDPSKIVTRNEWAPQDCVDKGNNIFNSGAECTKNIVCTQMPTGAPAWTAGSDSCSWLGDQLVCSHIFDSTEMGVNPFCERARVQGSCLTTGGTMQCFTDVHGEEHCWENEGNIESTCQELEDDPTCAYLESECIDGAFIAGACRAFSDIYDCGYDTEVEDWEIDQTITCGAEVRCMGLECVDTVSAKSESFNEVYATMQIAKFQQQDTFCPDDGWSECRIFEGDALQCKEAVGGIQDCCFEPSGVSLLEYMSLLEGAYAIDNIVQEVGYEPLSGAWQELKDPAVNTWNAVKEPFVEAGESLMSMVGVDGGGAAGGGISAMSESLAAFKQEAMQTAFTFVGDTFGAEAAGFIFETDAAGQVIGMNPALSAVMWAYQIYQMVLLIIQLIWPCEEEEFELAARRGVKSCKRVGSYCANKVFGLCIEERTSYCCYSSPLSRIVSEQVKMQGIGSWGSAENPNCLGIPISEMPNVDWTEVDLSEWIGILDVTGHLPDPTTYSMDSLTGNGSVGDLTGAGRENTQNRLEERMDGLDYETVIEEGTNSAGSVVPNVTIPDIP